jgi:hypothetical protein
MLRRPRREKPGRRYDGRSRLAASRDNDTSAVAWRFLTRCETEPAPERVQLSARIGIDTGMVVGGTGAGKEGGEFGNAPRFAPQGISLSEIGHRRRVSGSGRTVFAGRGSASLIARRIASGSPTGTYFHALIVEIFSQAAGVGAHGWHSKHSRAAEKCRPVPSTFILTVCFENCQTVLAILSSSHSGGRILGDLSLDRIGQETFTFRQLP